MSEAQLRGGRRGRGARAGGHETSSGYAVAMTAATSPQTFTFAFATAYRIAAAPFGVTPGNAIVTLGDGEFAARFGPWRVRTPLANITGVDVTGPYRFALTAGPAHLSFTDRGLTFATNGDRGLCLKFREPVAGIEPTGRLRHPGLTVTVADIDGLAAALR